VSKARATTRARPRATPARLSTSWPVEYRPVAPPHPHPAEWSSSCFLPRDIRGLARLFVRPHAGFDRFGFLFQFAFVPAFGAFAHADDPPLHVVSGGRGPAGHPSRQRSRQPSPRF